MSSWSHVLQLPEPVVGRVECYESARTQIGVLGEAAENVRREFRKIEVTGTNELKGRAADELREVVGSVDDCLRDLPIVLDDVETIFKKHADELERLRDRAEEALARAETRWDGLQNALTRETSTDGSLRSLQSQLRSLAYSTASSDYVEAERARLTASVSRQEGVLATRRATRETAEANLELSRTEHGELQGEEKVLVDATVNSLDGVDLRSLSNPSNLERLGGWLSDRLSDLADWVVDLVSDVFNMYVAIGQGRFQDALHHFRDYLDKISTALVVVGVIACLVAAPFTGGASLAAIPAILQASLILDAVRFGTSSYLYASQAPHPETGEPLTTQEYLVEAGFLAVGAGGSRVAAKVAGPITRGISKGLKPFKFLPKWTRYSNGFYDASKPRGSFRRFWGNHPNTNTRAFYDNTRGSIEHIPDALDVVDYGSDVLEATGVTERGLDGMIVDWTSGEPTQAQWETLGGQLDWVSEDNPAYQEAFEKLDTDQSRLTSYREDGVSLSPDSAVCQLVAV